MDTLIEKKSIFIIQLESLQEVDAVLPIVWQVKQSDLFVNSDYTIFLPIMPDNYDELLNKIFSRFGIEVIFPHEIFFSKSIMGFLKFSNSFLNKFMLFILKASFKSNLINKFNTRLFEWRLNKHMDEYAFCYLPFTSLRKEVKNTYINAFYNYFSSNQKTTIGFETHGFSNENGLTETDSLFSMVLTRFKPSTKDLNINSNYKLIGSPRFDKKFIEDYVSKTSDLFPEITKKFPNKEKNVLLLLKKLSPTYNHVISNEEKTRYRNWIISFIISKGYNVIIKPHPRESKKSIEKWVSAEGDEVNKKSLIYYGNTYSILNLCSLVVCEFPSEANLDVFAFGSKVIWPFKNYLLECNDDNFNTYVDGLINTGFDHKLLHGLEYNI